LAIRSLLGDELAIAQQMISDILTCFRADVLDRALLTAEQAPHRGAFCCPFGDGKRCPIEVPIEAAHIRRSLAPY